MDAGVIQSFKHKGLKHLYEKGDRSGIRPDLIERIEDILGALDSAEEASALNLPTYWLHKLTGDLKGFWSLYIRANWRMIFRFADGQAYDVELIDYH